MRLTTKGRFAVTAMIDLALRQGKGPVTLSGISQRQAISLSYLEQQGWTALESWRTAYQDSRYKLIFDNVVRGMLRLDDKASAHPEPRVDKVTVADIIIAVDEPLDATQCGGKENCHGADAASGVRCMTHELWATLNEKMVDYLDSVSLQDLVDQQKQKHADQNVVVMHRNENQAALG